MLRSQEAPRNSNMPEGTKTCAALAPTQSLLGMAEPHAPSQDDLFSEAEAEMARQLRLMREAGMAWLLSSNTDVHIARMNDHLRMAAEAARTLAQELAQVVPSTDETRQLAMVAALVIQRAMQIGTHENEHTARKQGPEGAEVHGPEGAEVHGPEGVELHGPEGAETNAALAPTQSCQGPEGARLHGPEGAELHGPEGAETNAALAPTQSCQGPEGAELQGPEGVKLHGPEGAELEDDDQPTKRRRHE